MPNTMSADGTKQLPAIVKLASSSFGITEDESNGVLEHLITGGDFSLYGLANAVTRFSQDVESYANPDLRGVQAPAEPSPALDVQSIILQLQQSPELLSALTSLISNQGCK